MSKKTLDRRKFLSLSATVGASALAACAALTAHTSASTKFS